MTACPRWRMVLLYGVWQPSYGGALELVGEAGRQCTGTLSAAIGPRCMGQRVVGPHGEEWRPAPGCAPEPVGVVGLVHDGAEANHGCSVEHAWVSVPGWGRKRARGRGRCGGVRFRYIGPWMIIGFYWVIVVSLFIIFQKIRRISRSARASKPSQRPNPCQVRVHVRLQ
jgi:hypothetical protein